MSRNATMDVKKSDPFLANLRMAFEWVIAQAVWIVVALVALAAIGGGWAVWHQMSESNEMVWQDKYSSVEKKFLDQKRSFQEAAQREQMKKADPKAAAAAVAPVGALPTGDLSKDYGAIVTEFESLIQEAPKTKAGEMAALNLAVLQAEHKQMDAALATLNKVNTSDRTKDLTGALTVNLKASLMASLGQCAEAVPKFQKIAGDKNASFLHQEAKLRMGLCYEKMNEFAKAQAVYSEISSGTKDAGDQGLSEDAERYLRLLKMKQTDQRGS
ncbi:MAG: tetratricopeptide repeat protein [Bdellovibrionaceae bacterium]|nr:tetratricopeptide repeat protein [Pseudobdellovibrionaceae bacterium]